MGTLAALAVACLLMALPAAVEAKPGRDAEGEAARSAGKRVDVVLRLQWRSGLQGLAGAVTDPASPRYGQYLGPRRIGKRFGARKGTRRHVRSFLRRHGIQFRVDVTRSFVEALVPARKARRLFGSSKRVKGQIPRGLRGSVRTVLQVDAAPDQFLPRRHQGGRADAPGGVSATSDSTLEPPYVRTGTPAGCDEGRDATSQPTPSAPVNGPAFTPSQIQAAYRASPLHAQGVTGHGVRAAVLGAGGFALPELQGFAECFGIEIPPTRLVQAGRRRAGETSVESALDLQMLTLMAPGLERLDVYDVGQVFLWPVFFSAVLDPRIAPGGRLPHVVSVSAGGCETKNDTSKAEVKLTERVLAAAAAAGVTVAAGSGDSGSFCIDGRVGFYPSSSRWVTSVGGTSLALTESNRIAEETVWNDVSAGLLQPGEVAAYSGGGGLSRYLSAPFYQRRFLGGGWGRRAYPDVAAMADIYPGIAVYCAADQQGNCDPASAANPFEPAFGTSAATPLLAGAVALANQRRLEADGPPLGFANPILYELGGRGGAGALRDVVRGSNGIDPRFRCCDARRGYDLASGWGSVDAEGLAAEAARSLARGG